MGCTLALVTLMLAVLFGVPTAMGLEADSRSATPAAAPRELEIIRGVSGRWMVVVTFDGDTICSEFRRGGGGSSGCGPAVIREAFLLATGSDRPMVAHGIVREDVDRVRLELATGGSVDVRPVSLEPLGLTARAFAARLPQFEDVTWYVALDVDGRELGRVTGPAGPRPSLPPLPTAEPLVLPPPSAERVCAAYRLRPSDAGADATELVQLARDTILRRLTALHTLEPRVEVRDPADLSISTLGGEELLRRLVAPGHVIFVPVPRELDASVQDGQPLPVRMADIEPLFGGEGIASARAVIDESPFTDEGPPRQPSVDLTLTPEAARILDDHAEDHQGERFAIVIDAVVHSSPSINAPDFGGEARITGASPEDVVTMAALLASGPLPAELAQISLGPCDDPA